MRVYCLYILKVINEKLVVHIESIIKLYSSNIIKAAEILKYYCPLILKQKPKICSLSARSRPCPKGRVS